MSDLLPTETTMVLVGGVRQPLLVTYDDLMQRRLTLRLEGGPPPETAYAVWCQVEAGLLRLDALPVATVRLDDPAEALARAQGGPGARDRPLLH